jgi:hypothetical protein
MKANASGINAAGIISLPEGQRNQPDSAAPVKIIIMSLIRKKIEYGI